MSGILLQQNIIYGPVFSRRLGRSLGVNLLPTDQKTCSYDCVYCEYGKAGKMTSKPAHEAFPSVDEILDDVEKALKRPRTIETITLSGNGEPTLHPSFLEIVNGVMTIKEKYRPDAKLAVLSNSSMIRDSHVIDALGKVDLPIMKLDAGDETTFQTINRPVAGIKFEDIFDGLKNVEGMIIQSMLIDGEISNIHGEAYENWTNALAALNPCLIQIYSIDRPATQDDVLSVSPMKLREITEDLQDRFGLRVDAYSRE
jgi:wyosine [tRNA(Phe)-imidazoG37] synthetase (radical SAM superfamily)